MRSKWTDRAWVAVPIVIAGVVALLVIGSGSQTGAILSKIGASVGGVPSAPEPGAVIGPAQPDSVASPALPDAVAVAATTRIVYTGTLAIRVADIEDATTRAEAAVAGVGGHVSGSERTSEGDRPSAEVGFRIPADRWEDGLTRLRAIGLEVLAERTSAVEVTGELVDLEARITNLRATEAALQAILARAEGIPDVLAVQKELTATRGQIEQLDGSRAVLADQAAYGTLSVSFTETVVAVEVAKDEWRPATEVDRAAATLVRRLQRLADIGIWFAIAWLPFLLVGGLVLAVGTFVTLRLRRRLDRPVATA